MSVTHSLELHLVAPNFHGNNRCGVFLWAGEINNFSPTESHAFFLNVKENYKGFKIFTVWLIKRTKTCGKKRISPFY